MHPIEPVELRGDLVAIEPLRAEHAAGLLAAADAEEVFAWLPYPRPADIEQARAWIDDALADYLADRRFPFAVHPWGWLGDRLHFLLSSSESPSAPTSATSAHSGR